MPAVIREVAGSGSPLNGVVRLYPPDRNELVAAIEHMKNGLDDFNVCRLLIFLVFKMLYDNAKKHPTTVWQGNIIK